MRKSDVERMLNLSLKRLFLPMVLLHCTGLSAIAADRPDNSVLLGLTGDLLVNRDTTSERTSRPRIRSFALR